MISPLHTRTTWSMLRGTMTPGQLVRAAAGMGHRSVACTELNSLAGAVEFWTVAKEQGLSPILGAELQAGDESAVAWVESQRGYANLCRLVTEVCAGKGLDVAGHCEGLVFLADTSAQARRIRDAGGEVYLRADPQSAVRQVEFPLVVAGEAMRVLSDEPVLAILLAKMRGEVPVRRRQEELWLRSPQQLAAEYRAFPDAIRNNEKIVERASAFQFLPRPLVFPSFQTPGNIAAIAHLRQLCEAGATRRYGHDPDPRVAARLAEELGVIADMGFGEYFLVVHDIVQYAQRHGAPIAGRGSGGSSLVAYVLGITNVCPLAMRIPFQRFLHRLREDAPDLDLDFCWRIRDDIIEYVFQRWGRQHVAMVCTHLRFQPRSALRATARAMGWTHSQASQMLESPEEMLASASPSRRKRIQATLDISTRILGWPQAFSVHPGGVVIAPGRIDAITPIQPSAKGVPVTQYDKDGVEAVGLVKLDILGNRAISTIHATCRQIEIDTGTHLDIDTLPASDPATMQRFRRADTVGCNQVESPAMRSLLANVQPTSMEDLMMTLALIRPGAASVGFKNTFIRRRRGMEPTPHLPAALDAILGNTSGVMVYEDDVMLSAAAMTPWSVEQADRFRKRVQKTKTDAQRQALWDQFLFACRAHGTDDALAEELWVQMSKFNSYSFCRAHAASYARLAYASVYLRTHYPAEYWLGAMNNNQSMYPIRTYVDQARRDGVGFDGPDVNASQAEWSLQGGRLRVGLMHIVGMGEVQSQRILDARARRAFSGIGDFLTRTHVGDAEAENLILCGALDSLGDNRPTLLRKLFLHRRAVSSEFCLFPPQEIMLSHPPDPFPAARRAADEWRLTGLPIRESYLAQFRPRLGRCVTIDSRQIAENVGRRVTLAGLRETHRITKTHRGEPMAFVTFGDEFGLFEAVLLPDAYQHNPPDLTRYGPHIITGTVQSHHDSIAIHADRIRLL